MMNVRYLFVVGAFCSLLVGCVVHLESKMEVLQHQMQVQQSTEQAISMLLPPTSPTIPPPTVVKPQCPLFQPPEARPVPRPVALEDPQVDTNAEIEQALKEYVRALHIHAAEERQRWMDAYQRYLEGCGL